MLGPVVAWLRAGFSWTRWLVLAVVVGLVSYGAGYLLSMLVLFPPPETAGSGIAVPELAGRTLVQAESTLLEAGLAVGDVRVVTSMEADSGQVLAQDPVAGQQLLPGAAVALGVSAGAPELRVPPVAGLGEAAARELLERVGFVVETRETRGADFPAGIVARSEPEAGTALELPAVITLVVSSGASDTASGRRVGGDG